MTVTISLLSLNNFTSERSQILHTKLGNVSEGLSVPVGRIGEKLLTIGGNSKLVVNDEKIVKTVFIKINFCLTPTGW